jgi:trans-aconitate 2-methyltransferase
VLGPPTGAGNRRTTPPQPEGIRDFYDSFLESRMLQYRVGGNYRIEMANEGALALVEPHFHVLELGCGIGLTSERICERLETGHLWACDISSRNIWYAQKTVRARARQATFFVADFVNDFGAVENQLSAAPDAVVMVDVLEHIPAASRPEVFSNLRRITAPKACLFLSFPSPGYQAKLRQENPAELQPVDEVIRLEDLTDDARASGWHIRSWSLKDVWLRNQYVHAVLCRDIGVEAWTEEQPRARRLLGVAMARLVQPVARRYRYWKYVTRVFGHVGPDSVGRRNR